MLDYHTRKIMVTETLESIRHEPYEVFLIMFIRNNRLLEIFRKKGTQFDVGDIDINEINRAILFYRMKYTVNNFPLYIVHNHPYIYNASPSQNDLLTKEIFVSNADNMNYQSHNIKSSLEVEIVDFGIVTEFDYWSYHQECI